MEIQQHGNNTKIQNTVHTLDNLKYKEITMVTKHFTSPLQAYKKFQNKNTKMRYAHFTSTVQSN